MPITFSEEDLNLPCYPHTDAMVINANISSLIVIEILVDTGSSADKIFGSTFDRMNIDRKLLQPSEVPLMGSGKESWGTGKDFMTNILWQNR